LTDDSPRKKTLVSSKKKRKKQGSRVKLQRKRRGPDKKKTREQLIPAQEDINLGTPHRHQPVQRTKKFRQAIRKGGGKKRKVEGSWDTGVLGAKFQGGEIAKRYLPRQPKRKKTRQPVLLKIREECRPKVTAGNPETKKGKGGSKDCQTKREHLKYRLKTHGPLKGGTKQPACSLKGKKTKRRGDRIVGNPKKKRKKKTARGITRTTQ